MDEQGIDMEAISINPFWYGAERDKAEAVIKLQNEKTRRAGRGASRPLRRLRNRRDAAPDLAVQQLEHGIKKLGLRGMSVGASVEGLELADPKFHPIWAKAEELGCLVFMHPGGTKELASRLKGNGGLDNTIGNPLDTTLALSHLIFEGTLDRFPGLKICAAHGGGYLPFYAPRSDAICVTFPDRCSSVPLKKKPTEYLKQLYYDSIVFTPQALKALIAEVRRPDRDGHRLPIPLDQHVGRPHPQHAGLERRRQDGDAGRYRGAAVGNQNELGHVRGAHETSPS
jgi:Predicted metal-dependent hydrolase of the TIM-barrel fold